MDNYSQVQTQTQIQAEVIILAAGKGSRLNTDIPKPLLTICGKKLIDYSIDACLKFFEDNKLSGLIKIVVGHQSQQVISHIKKMFSPKVLNLIKFIDQKEQLGTGHAVQQCFLDKEKLKQKEDSTCSTYSNYSIIMCSDTPLVDFQKLSDLYLDITKNPELDAIATSFIAEEPFGYGRIIRERSNASSSFSIVEQKDLVTNNVLNLQKSNDLNEVNAGLYIIKTKYLINEIHNLSDENQSGEFYLTDIFKKDKNVKALLFKDQHTFEGINDLLQLHNMQKIMFKKYNQELLKRGVLIDDIESTCIDRDVIIKNNVRIGSNTTIKNNSVIENGVSIEGNCIINNSTIKDNVTVLGFCHIEGTIIGNESVVGPFARLRPGAIIDSQCKVGNFVELKKSHLENGVKISHLSYVGDAEIGSRTNIGCGFITCNYDGKNKHKTVIGKDCFIGSDTQVIAPINIGDNCYTASGSTLTNDLPDQSFSIARSRQITKKAMSKYFKGKE